MTIVVLVSLEQTVYLPVCLSELAYIISKPLVRPGWCQDLLYKCTETGLQFICMVYRSITAHKVHTRSFSPFIMNVFHIHDLYGNILKME